MRKPISKALRLQVYEKYDGHCAYCGKPLKPEEMQVDHIYPYGRVDYGDPKAMQMVDDGSMNAIENLMPACRACNFYKSMDNIEGFRRRLLTELEHTCRATFQTRLAMQYGMITYTAWSGEFYFEKREKEKQNVSFEYVKNCKWL
ncbi:MAG: HNH endonuclease [Salinivirgaceae bacterium]|nr:HNH endonuclease [Salinivirgaceae bacterium]